ncbi:hypothetical protein GON03_06655 [Nocardioides sp. MAH-18]|uniref:Uncharacterized protein n=1 Tax=Nocardioides agri TaxID=2682843 RepID=A0A6L6XQA6_9ACTN|nr:MULTISPECIES: hypothetical protein [unclassified Nocardioides]MBA2953994.1 hypothetical protein [Nocardioides sp. CGMCC 1.13656]MVQ48857.1 hypothetical protein [Nocardioides sp. MAH-18]
MSGYSRWDQKPALGRRGMVLAVVIPVLIAAAAFGVVSLVSRGSESTATTIRVPTSEWIPGQDAGDALIVGVIAVDDHRCVYLQGSEGRLWPVWPAGFRGKLDEAGHVTLYDGGDNVVGRDGDRVQASGSYSPPAAYAGEPCLPDDGGEVAAVQSEVTRVD